MTIIDSPAYQIPEHGLPLPFIKQTGCGTLYNAVRFSVKVEFDGRVDVDSYDAGRCLFSCRCFAASLGPLNEYGSAAAQGCL